MEVARSGVSGGLVGLADPFDTALRAEHYLLWMAQQEEYWAEVNTQARWKASIEDARGQQVLRGAYAHARKEAKRLREASGGQRTGGPPFDAAKTQAGRARGRCTWAGTLSQNVSPQTALTKLGRRESSVLREGQPRSHRRRRARCIHAWRSTRTFPPHLQRAGLYRLPG